MKKFIILSIIAIAGISAFSNITIAQEDINPQDGSIIDYSGNQDVKSSNKPVEGQQQYINQGLKIGYVDVAKVFEDSSRTKKAKADLDEEIKSREKIIREMEKEIRNLRKEFEDTKENLTEELKKEKEALIEEKSNQIQEFTNKAEEELSTKETQLSETIIGEIYNIIYSLGKAGSFSVILDKSNIIYGDKNLDLTEEVIRRLEK